MERIYLDNNATTEPHAELKSQLADWFEAWGNPSSVHQSGRRPKALIRDARKQLADLLGCTPLEVVFTSSGSEANNQIIKGFYFEEQKKEKPRNHYLVTQVEHPSVLKAFGFLESLGAEIEFIEVNRDGEIDLENFKKQLRPDTALVSCMIANNETGSIYPIKKMAKLAHESGALFHSDCVQAVGKMLFNVKDLDIDFGAFSSHKFYSIRGAGAAYIKTGNVLHSLIHGGGQERNRRAGTENVMAIAAMGYMASKKPEMEDKIEQMRVLRDSLESQVMSSISGIQITGVDGKRISNTSNMIVSGIDGETLLMNLDIKGVSISTGAACSSGSQEPSPTLQAMGLSRAEAQSSMRVSLSWNTTEEDVENFVQILNEVVDRIRSFSQSEQTKGNTSDEITSNV